MLTEHIALPECEPADIHSRCFAGSWWELGYWDRWGRFSSLGTVGWHDRDAALDELRTRIRVYKELTC